MGMTNGRADNFAQGSVESSNQRPTPNYVKNQQPAESYTPKSVLDNFQPTGNGFGAADRSRLLPGGSMLPNQNGKSETTQQQAVWLSSPYRTIG